MNQSNLIKLGAYAQLKFNMKSDFSVIQIPSDAFHRYRVAMKLSGRLIDYDEVVLEKFGSTENFESVWCGYSPRANVLVVQDTNSLA